jgi:NADH-quinone oxidoreductase subunit L
MIGTSIITFLIIGISYWMYVSKQKVTKDENDFTGWEKLSSKKLYLDEIYHALFVKPIEWKASKVLPFIENNILVKGIGLLTHMISFSGSQIRKIQTGILSSYFFWMILGIVGLISYYLIYIELWNF